jgi:CRISPR-associated protein Csn2
MKLVHPLLPTPMTFEENKINLLVLENPRELRKAVLSLLQQIEGGEGDFVLSEDFAPIALSKYAELITDPFALPLSSKKITGKLNRAACEAGEPYEERFRKIAAEINDLAAQIGMNMELSVTFTPLEQMDALIDLLKFRIDQEELSFPEQILSFMILYRSFFGTRLFVFYNLKACLDEEELTLLYRSICYEKLHVLLLEDQQRGTRLPEENSLVIDKDLCIF